MQGVRTYRCPDPFELTRDVILEAKAGRTVSVCIPCRNEAETVGPLVSAIRDGLMTGSGVVDELIVLDDRSTDSTARVAADAGARVVPIGDIHATHGDGRGKGNALWATLLASEGDFVVWCDGDVTNFDPSWVVKLVLPMLADDTVGMVKAMYHRPDHFGGGGRTTELVARPLLSRYFPELTAVAQPLSGEYAGRRSVLEALPFVQGWGVEVALLIDIAARWGSEAISQVDLGSRMHRHRPLESLSLQAAEVMATVLERAGESPAAQSPQALRRADGSEELLNTASRPSLASLGLSRRSAA